jgi:hypothetical protein
MVDEALKARLRELISFLSDGTKDLSTKAPGMQLPLGHLLHIRHEDLDTEIEKLSTEHPEWMAPLCLYLEAQKKFHEFTQRRIDSRVQRPGQSQEKQPFKNFVKRKAEW